LTSASPKPDSPPLSHAEIVRLEEVEAAGHADWLAATTRDFREKYGFTHRENAGWHLFTAGAFDVLALNAVLVTGAAPPPDRETIESWKESFRRAGSRRFFVQVSPAVASPPFEADLLACGLRSYNRWARLWRSLDELPAASAVPRVERIGAKQAEAFGRIVAGGFEMPAELWPWFAAAIGRTGWSHYLAFDGDDAIAAAGFYPSHPVGWMGFAATREDRRGRGAQTALILRRLEDARALGLNRVTVETAEDKPEKPAPSFRNLRRLGFRFAYHRPNYLFEFSPAGSS
jgi:GNAT superfamily N-acetyltransferase